MSRIPKLARRSAPKLTAERRAELQKEATIQGVKTTAFEVAKCVHCGGLHLRACPRVKRLVFHPGGSQQLAEVEFWPAGEWSDEGVIWPEDVFVDEPGADADATV